MDSVYSNLQNTLRDNPEIIPMVEEQLQAFGIGPEVLHQQLRDWGIQIPPSSAAGEHEPETAAGSTADNEPEGRDSSSEGASNPSELDREQRASFYRIETYLTRMRRHMNTNPEIAGRFLDLVQQHGRRAEGDDAEAICENLLSNNTDFEEALINLVEEFDQRSSRSATARPGSSGSSTFHAGIYSFPMLFGGQTVNLAAPNATRPATTATSPTASGSPTATGFPTVTSAAPSPQSDDSYAEEQDGESEYPQENVGAIYSSFLSNFANIARTLLEEIETLDVEAAEDWEEPVPVPLEMKFLNKNTKLYVNVDLCNNAEDDVDTNTCRASEKGKEPVCGVCLEEVEARAIIRELPCRHRYHYNCIDAWFEKSCFCPTCRHDVRKTWEERWEKESEAVTAAETVVETAAEAEGETAAEAEAETAAEAGAEAETVCSDTSENET